MIDKKVIEFSMRFALSDLAEGRTNIVDLLVENMLRDMCTACKFVDETVENLDKCLYCNMHGDPSKFEMDEEAFEFAKGLIYEAVAKTGDRR